MIYIKQLSFILVLLVCGAGSASAERFVLCDYCGESEFAEVAEANAPPRTSGAVLIGDSRRNVIRKFWVLVQYEGGGYVRHAMERAVPAADRESWLKVDRLIDLSRGSLKSIYLPQGFHIGSAYELPGNTWAVTQLSNFIQSHHWFQSAVLVNFNALTNTLFNWLPGNWTLNVRVFFPDGSSVVLETVLAFSLGDGLLVRLEPVDGLAFDSDGNRIPFSAAEFASARGQLTGTNIQHWLNEAWRNGINVIRIGAGGGGLRCSFRCQASGSSCTLECVPN